MMKSQPSFVQRHPTAIYFMLAYALGWSVWIPMAMARHGPQGEQLNLSLTLLAGMAPGVAATLAAWMAYGRKGAVFLWGRLLRWRIGPVWYAAALAIPAALPVLTAGLVVLLRGEAAGALRGIQPASIVMGLVMYIPMALFEEVGWRGFAQPGLQRRRSGLGASVILGMAWSIWHLPYFLIPEFSFFPAGSALEFALYFVVYAVGTIPTCILIGWMFNNARGSLILPCIFHGATNVFSGTFLIPLVKSEGLAALGISVGLSTLAALIVVMVYGGRRLMRVPAEPENPAFELEIDDLPVMA